MRARKNKITVYLNDEELSSLNEMVEKTSLNREQFIRDVLDGYTIREAPPAPLWETVCRLKRVASDMRIIADYSMFKEVSDVTKLRQCVEDTFKCVNELTERCMPEFKEVKKCESRKD